MIIYKGTKSREGNCRISWRLAGSSLVVLPVSNEIMIIGSDLKALQNKRNDGCRVLDLYLAWFFLAIPHFSRLFVF
jgi:hypothetical protein